MQSQRDQNLMDAWQKGGMFEGQKATDSLVISHWKGRLAGVDKSDPLYDTYKNTITQYEYAISESKASTEYAQGKRSDASMAQFYLGWAKKVPQDSEFWRVLQRDAAQFMRASSSKAKAAADKAKELAYQQAQDADYKKNEAAGEYMTNVLRDLARSNALIGADQNTDLSQFDPSDPATMLRLLDTITLTAKAGAGVGKDSGNAAVLYHDPITGAGITGAAIVAQLRKLDPHFDGRVTLDYVRGLMTRQLTGQGIRLKRAEDTGHATDVSNLKKWQAYTSETGREAGLWPVQTSYNQARATFLATWQSGTATPDDKIEAWKQYASTLTKLSTGATVDDNTRARLLAEVNGDGSVKSMAEDFTGLNSVDNTNTSGGFKGDIAETHFDVQRYIAMQDAVATGAAVWTTGKTNDQGVFTPQPGGKEIGAATLADVQAASPVPPAVIFVPQGGSSKTIPVVVTGANITAFANNEKGEKVAITDQNPVGAFYDVTVGGRTTRVYSYKGGDGKTYYTASTPWDDASVQAHDTPQGLSLDLSAFVPHQDKGGSWFYANGQPADVSGNKQFGLSDPKADGSQFLVMNPSRAVYMSDPARAAAGPDPATDSFSPTIAALVSTAEGRHTLATLKDDPQFQQQLAFEAQRAATDPSTGAVDQSALATFNQQAKAATQMEAFAGLLGGALGAGLDLWNRVNTKPTFEGVIGGPQITQNQRLARLGEAPSALPADTVRGTQFGALADAFHAGNMLLKQPTNTLAGTQLQLAGTIKVPDVPPRPMTTPTPTPAPAPIAVNTTVAPPPPVVTTVAPPVYTPPQGGSSGTKPGRA